MSSAKSFQRDLATSKELPFHTGLKLGATLNDKQKQIVKFNSETDRFLYNCKVGDGRHDYHYRILGLVNNVSTLQQTMPLSLWRISVGLNYAVKYVYEQPCYSLLALNYWFSTYRKSLKDKDLPILHPWMNRKLQHGKSKAKMLDTLMFKNVTRKYQASWNLFQKVSRASIPTFHHKSYNWSYQTSCCYSHDIGLTTGSIRFVNRNDKMYLKLPKLGYVQVHGSYQRFLNLDQKHPIRIATVTIKHWPTGKFTVSLALASNQPFVNLFNQKRHLVQDLQAVGIDFNTSKFASQSIGCDTINPRYYWHELHKLKKLQHILSRRQRRAKAEQRSLRTSKNYQKQRTKVAKLQRRIANRRENFLQNFTTALIENQDLVVSENLQSSNLLRNHRIAMSINDVGWRRCMEILAYKCQQTGKLYLKVDPKYTTQVCNQCGFRMGTRGTHKLQLGQEQWSCPQCHCQHDRDWNAAKNILTKGFEKLLTRKSKAYQQAAKQYLAKKYDLPFLANPLCWQHA